MFALILHGWRSWKHARTVGLLAVAALAIGIGSTTAIYTVIHAVLLNPLPYADPDRYLSVQGAWRGLPGIVSAWSYPNAIDFEARARTLDAFGCASVGNYNLIINGRAVHVDGTEVSPALMRSLGVPLPLGQWFKTGASDLHNAVISQSLWARSGFDSQLIGKPMIVNGLPFTVVGVAPAWFRFPIDQASIDIWVPLEPTVERDNNYLACFAKKKPGLGLGQVEDDLKRVAGGLEREYPVTERNHTVAVQPLLGDAVKGIRPSLLLLLAAAGALLLISCANVASLLLARSVVRARETAIRVALGGTLWQLALQYFSEGILVSVAGAACGSVLSIGLVRVVLSLASSQIPRADQIRFNWQVLLFALLVAVLCGVLFSLAPLWQAMRTPPNEVLSDGVRASASARSRSLLRVFVVAETALAFVLVASASLFLQYLGILYRIHPGFDPNHVLTFSMYAPPAKYPTAEARGIYQSRLAGAIENLPGVESAGFTSRLPLTSYGSDVFFFPDGRDRSALSFRDQVALFDFELRWVSSGFFRAMGIPLVGGELLRESGWHQKPLPVVISEIGARRLWPHGGAVGSGAKTGDTQSRVTGVVGDVRGQLGEPLSPHVYLLYRPFWPSIFTMHWAVRSHLEDQVLIQELRQAVANVDPQQALFDFQPMSQIVEESLGREKLQSFMVSFFAGAALLLSMLGVYGVVAYSVRQRIPEMGTRMALGATGGNLLRLVVWDGFKMAALGVAIGLVLLFIVVRVLSNSALGITVHGPEPFLVSTALIGALTLLACWYPAWRATLLSPMIAIRNAPDAMWEHARERFQWLRSQVSIVLVHSAEGGIAESALLAEMVDSSRQAESFGEAVQQALATLSEKLHAQSAVLLTRRAPDQPFRCSHAVPATNVNWSLPADSLLLNRLRHYGPALPVSAADIDALSRWAKGQAPERLEEIATLQSIGPALAVALMTKAEVTGILFLGPTSSSKEYTSFEKRLLRSVAAQFALMLENARLTDRIVEQERLRRELMLASEVQKRLFPEQPFESASLQLAGFCLPARGVGGDYYDFLNIGEHQIGIALADVAGKGIAAALIMSIVQASLRSLVGNDGASLGDLAGKINRLLHRSTGPSSYATFFYAQFDDQTRQLRYVNAGHNPPFLLRNGGHSVVPFVASAAPVEELATGGMIIGMFSQCAYEEATLQLQSGDVLMLFTDGVSEAHNPNEDEFGEERLRDLLRRTAHLPINDMSASVLAELQAWMQDASQHDDLTFVLVKVQ